MQRLIIKAKEFAKKAHKGQKQATGRSYFEHPLKVAEFLKKWKQDDEVICAGLLHDTVEDCNIPLKQLKKSFGKRVAMLVDGMSIVLIKKSGRTIKDMDATYKKFAIYTKKEPSLVLIKMADMLSNIPNIHVKSQRIFIINKSYPKLKMFWIPFIRESGFKKYAYKIKKELNKYTKKRIKSVLYNYINKKELNKIKKRLTSKK